MVVLVGIVALSAPLSAQADPYTPPVLEVTEPDPPALFACPEAPTASESEDPLVSELRELRRDQAAVCAAADEMLGEIVRRQWWMVAELDRVRSAQATDATLVNLSEDVQTLHGDLTKAGGLEVFLAGYESPLSVEVPAGVDVANPPDVAAVEAAVVQGTETGNQNLWALAGLATGALLLFAFYRLVRP